MNKNGKISTGAVILIVAVIIGLFLLYQNGNLNGILNGNNQNNQPSSKAPSTQLTSLQINTLDALASTTTSAPAVAYVFSSDGSQYVTSGATTSSSTAFTVNYGKTYKVVVINTTAGNGYYPVQFDVNADSANVNKQISLYKTGSINVIGVTSSADPAAAANIAAAAGKTCGFTVTFSENTTAAAFNKPLIMCQGNVSTVTQINIPADGMGIVSANNLAPSRVTATAGYTYWTYELPKMVLSTDGTYKVGGTVTFSASSGPASGPVDVDTMKCKIIDQTDWINSNYQTMSLTDGFKEAAQNGQTLTDIGAIDSNTGTLTYNSSATSYC